MHLYLDLQIDDLPMKIVRQLSRHVFNLLPALRSQRDTVRLAGLLHRTSTRLIIAAHSRALDRAERVSSVLIGHVHVLLGLVERIAAASLCASPVRVVVLSRLFHTVPIVAISSIALGEAVFPGSPAALSTVSSAATVGCELLFGGPISLFLLLNELIGRRRQVIGLSRLRRLGYKLFVE